MARPITRRAGTACGDLIEPRRRRRQNPWQRRGDHDSDGNCLRFSGSRQRRAVLRGRTAAIGVGLADTLARATGGLTGVVHRALLLVRTTVHACFGRRQPALALGDMTDAKHEDRRQRRQTAHQSEHGNRMLKALGDVKTPGLDLARFQV